MSANQRQWLRKPSERVGTLAQAALPPPTNSESKDEQRLLRALRARDAAAFESLLDLYYSPMLHLAEGYVRSREEAEEVVQDTWLGVLAGLDRFEGRSSLKTWIFRILVNRARTRAKREARMLPFSSLGPATSPEQIGGSEGVWDAGRLSPETEAQDWYGRAWAPPTPEDQFLTGELMGRIRSIIDELPPRQREVITLRDVDGWAAEEVCSLLNISEANQRVLLHRARVKVRDALTEYAAAGESSDPVPGVPISC